MVYVSPWEARTAITLRSLCMSTLSALMSRRSTLNPAVVSTIATFCGARSKEVSTEMFQRQHISLAVTNWRKRECFLKRRYSWLVLQDKGTLIWYLRRLLWHRCTFGTRRSSGPSWSTVGRDLSTSSWRLLGTWKEDFVVEPCFLDVTAKGGRFHSFDAKI